MAQALSSPPRPALAAFPGAGALKLRSLHFSQHVVAPSVCGPVDNEPVAASQDVDKHQLHCDEFTWDSHIHSFGRVVSDQSAGPSLGRNSIEE